jgi:hypothetical protein
MHVCRQRGRCASSDRSWPSPRFPGRWKPMTRLSSTSARSASTMQARVASSRSRGAVVGEGAPQKDFGASYRRKFRMGVVKGHSLVLRLSVSALVQTHPNG